MRRRMMSALLLMLLLSAGCSPAATPSGATSRPHAPVTLPASPGQSISCAQRLIATIRVDNGDGLAAAGGAIWVKTDDGRVVRVDPKTSRGTGEVLPIGTPLTITHATPTYRHKIVSRTELTTQGGSATGLIHDDLILQTCRGTGTFLTYATLV